MNSTHLTALLLVFCLHHSCQQCSATAWHSGVLWTCKRLQLSCLSQQACAMQELRPLNTGVSDTWGVVPPCYSLKALNRLWMRALHHDVARLPNNSSNTRGKPHVLHSLRSLEFVVGRIAEAVLSVSANNVRCKCKQAWL